MSRGDLRAASKFRTRLMFFGLLGDSHCRTDPVGMRDVGSQSESAIVAIAPVSPDVSWQVADLVPWLPVPNSTPSKESHFRAAADPVATNRVFDNLPPAPAHRGYVPRPRCPPPRLMAIAGPSPPRERRLLPPGRSPIHLARPPGHWFFRAEPARTLRSQPEVAASGALSIFDSPSPTGDARLRFRPRPRNKSPINSESPHVLR